MANFSDEHANFQDGEMFPLRQAVANNNMTEVRRLLAHGANPNQQTAAGTGAFGVAILHRNLPMVELLLRHGAHPDQGVPDSLPLTLAMNMDDLDIVEALLAANANVYVLDPYLELSPMEYLEETTFTHDAELREMFQHHVQRRRRLMSRGRNVRALNVALGKQHGNHLQSIPAGPVSILGSFLSGSKRPSLRLQTENLRIQASPPASSPSASPPPKPRKRKTRRQRHSRRRAPRVDAAK